MRQLTSILLTVIFVTLVLSLRADVVTTSGRQLLVNDIQYTIKGICYHPVLKGSEKRSFENLTEDLALMKEAGINTIRVYVPITDKDVLDEIDAAGFKVIMGIGYNQGGQNDILSGSFIDYVNTFKSHNAILLWELGNEYNYHPEWFGGDIRNWYSALNNAANLIHQNDPKHPVTTAHGELPDSLALVSCPDVDIWGMNVYRWDNPEEIFSEWAAVSTKPMYLSEAGADSFMSWTSHGFEEGKNEKAQANAITHILDDVFRYPEICSGVTLYAFVDELWKAGNPESYDSGGWAPKSSGVPYDGTANEEYWGIVTIDRTKKAAFQVVKEKYNYAQLVLKNENLEIQIDRPLENYHFSRFDWTGKIVSVKYKGISVSGIERTDVTDENTIGKGFYNEFGINSLVAYDELNEGDWFHKIGIGALKKDDEPYSFRKKYEIKPSEFEVKAENDKVTFVCTSPQINGYSYVLTKEIELLESGFTINYCLTNTCEKTIVTNEYVHNFLAINKQLVDSNYVLKFPFQVVPELFDASVNPEGKVEIGNNKFSFTGTPDEQFFFSNLSGNEFVDASWELVNTKSKIGISETGNFKTNKIVLWGWKHVISPELFFDINLEPGQQVKWKRIYKVFEIE